MSTDIMLTWGTPHSFRIWQDDRGIVHGTFIVVKPRGRQTLNITFPGGITVDAIANAWHEQGDTWLELYPPVRRGRLFATTRVIVLKQHNILWYVLHIDDFPQDACMVIRKPVQSSE